MTRRDEAQYEPAKQAITRYLEGGDWRASWRLHNELAAEVPEDWLFGAIKKELGIEHRRIQGRYYWRLPQ